jgi:hypothetical protein
MEALIVIANLGRIRPVKYRPAGDDPREKPHIVEMPEDNVEMKVASVSEIVTDQAGRNNQSGPNPGQENHLKLEVERDAIERIASRISEIVAAEGNLAWRLVAPPTILPALQDALKPAARKAMAHAEPGDLTRMPLPDLEKRFLK